MRLDSVDDLLTAIDGLPGPARDAARARVMDALERPAPAARMALGLLALDLAGEVAAPEPAEVILLPELDVPAAASA